MPGAQSDMGALNRIRKASHTDVARLQPHGYTRAHRLITFKAKGRTAHERERVLAEACAVDAAGAFAILVEGVAPDLADEITTTVKVPTVGIGASQGCDGQVLVTDDMLGLFDWTPKFVRRYADLRSTIDTAVSTYAADVRSGSFPAEAELYRLKKA